MSDYDQLLHDAYAGELFGNAISGAMAGRAEWSEHRATLGALAAIEQRTALTALVAHKQTISAFAQLELPGHHDISTTLLTRYLETAP
jgi:hypothetical protein